MTHHEAVNHMRWLYDTYARVIDERDCDALRALVTDDVVLRRPQGETRGADAFLEQYAAVLSSPPLASRHVVSGVDACPGGGANELVARAAFTAWFFEGAATRVVFGRYDDRVRLVGGTPRFATKGNLIDHSVLIGST